jgi:hypothetical protein
MQLGLSEHFGNLGEIRLFRDRDPERGIRPGRDWVRSIVEAGATAGLFFWQQSPRWLASPVCRFEFDLFRDRVARIAEHYSTALRAVDSEILWGHLVIPIHWAELSEAHWSDLDPALRQTYEAHWRRSQRSPHLDFVERIKRGEPRLHDFGPLSHAASAEAFNTLEEAADMLGVTLPAFLRHLQQAPAGFVQDWMREFDRRVLNSAPPGHAAASPVLHDQQRLARLACSGYTGRPMRQFGLDMALIPFEGGQEGFWAMVAPADQAMAEQAKKVLPTLPSAQRGPAGHMLWPAALAEGLCDLLAAQNYDLRLPDHRAAERLRQLSLDPDGIVSLGLKGPCPAFWHRDPAGGLAGSKPLPLILVSKPLGDLHG